jgi:hypothetical protein
VESSLANDRTFRHRLLRNDDVEAMREEAKGAVASLRSEVGPVRKAAIEDEGLAQQV